MSKSIFISHAVADKVLVKAFTDFLMEGIGVPEDEIFCSSLEGMNIPAGKNFVEHIRQQIEAPKLMILMLTPSYRASLFCIAEMGAAWAMAHDIFPIIVPPIGHKEVDAVLLGTQVRKVGDKQGFPNELRDRVQAIVTCKKVSGFRWDQKRDEFFEKLPGILTALKTPVIIDEAAHNALEANYADALAALSAAEALNASLAEQLAEVSKLKDKAEVHAITASDDDEALVESFEELINDVKLALAELGTTEVRRAVLAEHHDQPYTQSRDYNDEFAIATRRKVFTRDGDLNHSNSKVRDFTGAMTALERFIAEHEYELAGHIEAEFGGAVDLDNEDFWNEHFL